MEPEGGEAVSPPQLGVGCDFQLWVHVSFLLAHSIGGINLTNPDLKF